MRRHGIALGAAIAVMTLSGAAVQASTDSGGAGLPPPRTGVQPKPLTGTPHFSVAGGTPLEYVTQLVQCGGTMYAVGSFSQVLQGGKTYRRYNVMSFSASPPFRMTSWAPRVSGPVDSITFVNGNCSRAYIGGNFKFVDVLRANNIAEINASTGNLVRAFAHNASAEVHTVLAVNGHVLVGGDYTNINGSSAHPYLTSLNPSTGKADGFVQMRISGHYQYPGAAFNPTRIWYQALSHNRRLDLLTGDFTSVGPFKRQQIFMLNVSGSKAYVTRWTSPAFNGHCATAQPFYLRAASWSPSDSTVYTASTGHSAYGSNGRLPQTGLCDAAAAFPATQASVKPRWINYTGCDSLYSTAADAGTAYFGGHERWSMNPFGCNFRGSGAYPAVGMEGLSPATGQLYLNSVKTAGYYYRSRGRGADNMLITRAGLWIASDNESGSQWCGYTKNLSGICLLPYK